MSDWKVTIEFKNKDMETVLEREYDFVDYTAMLDRELKRVLKNVEDAFFYFSNYKPKEEWDKDLLERFDIIRHKMLDQANAIKRLPQNLSYKGMKADQVSISDFINQTMK